MSLYEEQLEAKIKRQKSEITRLLKENAELKSDKAEGQEEAWKLAQKIIAIRGYSLEEIEEIFGTKNASECLLNYTYTEAAAKVAEWEQKKEEICVGDVLLSNETGNKCIVTRISNEAVTTLWNDGSCGDRPKNLVKGRFKKIGHIDINTWLAQIGGKDNDNR